jgi:GNAT superfamily N-acetyltransferase
MDLAARADANYYHSWGALARIMDGGAVVEDDGLLLTDLGLGVRHLNVAFVTRPLADPVKQVRHAMEFFAERGSPFVVRIREGLDPASEAACEHLGMPYADTVPGMASVAMTALPAPAELSIERVTTPEALVAFCLVVGRGFDLPGELAERLLPPAILLEPDIDLFLGHAEGKPVATSTLIRSDGVAGVHHVATLPEFRRRGLGEAMTWHAVAAGARYGCDMAALQASEMGRPIYERMGFRLVSPYRTFHLPGA